MVQERLEQLIRERRLEERCRRQQQSRIRERTKFVVMVAIEKCSYDPRENFRESMMEMITADHIKEARDLAYSAGSSFMEALEGELTQLGAIDDIEKLREYLEILEWQVFGGSYKSTFALAYSQAHPDKIDRYQKVDKSMAEMPMDKNEISITSQGRVFAQIILFASSLERFSIKLFSKQWVELSTKL
ncbi:uncharacterized protein LOC107608975 isoform X1 [Arachis ipaensis]|uniref:uncharacterized protein LOC107608975 isoform X1 n=1 Tax=Arachis ipaensis TaxID=130454 RepID=UPI000A2B7AD5|nr:uncharacterized protein LOC107608975 isoform X1 [Arachis ipaensis]XP_020962737.1 uncharacterized protein LOC107608975 isoform X1 [Arachis ipaensis]XP_025668101.1 uncharacterized protein LOC112766422 isoform X1 [Arachis hypogaea]